MTFTLSTGRAPRACLEWSAVCAALVLASCKPQLAVTPTSQITCADTSECPVAYHCEPATGLCAKDTESAPGSKPTMLLPEADTGQTALKNGDLVQVSGTAEPGAKVKSARLLYLADLSDAQLLDSVTLDDSGRFAGLFRAQNLTDGASVKLEVVVQARGFASDPANSRSDVLAIDNTAPANASIGLHGGARAVSSESVTLAPAASGATEMFLDGDLVDAAAVRHWIAYDNAAPATLAAGDGDKVLRARFRDAAHNVVEVSSSVRLSKGKPAVTLHLSGGKVAGKTNDKDTLAVSGTVEAGGTAVTLVSAEMLFLDSSGAALTAAGCEPKTVATGSAGITLTGTTFGGSVAMSKPCSSAAEIAVRVAVQNAAGVSSDPAASVSNALVYDDLPPAPASAVHVPSGEARQGYANTAKATLKLTAFKPDGSRVFIKIDGDVQTPDIAFSPFVPDPGTDQGQVTVTLSAADGLKNVRVTFADELDNEAVASVPISRLTSPPPAPLAGNLKLVESPPAGGAFDPAKLADSNNGFDLSWNTTTTGVDRALVYSDSALTNLLTATPLPVNASGFDATVPYDAAESYWVVAVDLAGNHGLATQVTVPKIAIDPPSAGGAAAGLPVRAGQTVTITLRPDVAMGATTVQVAGGSTTGSGNSFTYLSTGSEPEGLDKAVVRATAADGQGKYALGTQGTDAIAMTFDFHAPTLDAAKVTVAQNPPGTADSVSGAAGAVTDNISAADKVKVEVYQADGTTLIQSVSAAADGSFGPISIGDNVNASVVVKAVDEAGNRSAGATFANDIVKPTIANLAISPSAQRPGGSVTVQFDVSDDASNLKSMPAVTLAGNAASCTGTLTTSDKLPHHFSCSYVVQLTDAEKVQPVSVTATDAAGNAALAAGSVIFDQTAPTSFDTTPGNKTAWNGSPAILGGASDNLSGVAKVEVSIKDVAAGQWWNGTAFAAAAEAWLPTVGTTSWAYTGAVSYVSARSYTLRWRATDLAGNVEVPASSATFTFDPTLPAAVTGLTATSVADARIDLAWGAVAGAASYRVYYAPEGSQVPPFAGTGAAQGASPLSVASTSTTLSVTGLPRGRYVFSVTNLDAGGRESAYSATAAAASRWWKWANGSTTSNELRSVVALSANNFVAVGASGAIFTSHDGGLSWTPHYAGPQVGDLTAVVKAGTAVVAAGSLGITRSTDGGDTWTFVQTAQVAQSIGQNPYLWSNGSDVVVSLFGAVLHSADCGATSTKVQHGIAGTLPVSGSGSTAVLVSSTAALRSVNGGATWAAATIAGSPGSCCNAVAMTGNDAVAIGNNGAIMVSHDGGANWGVPTTRPTSTGPMYMVLGAGSFFVAPDYANGPISVTHDGGTTWTTTTGSSLHAYSQAGWTDGTSVLVAGGGFFNVSSNSGASYTPVSSISPLGLAYDGATLVAAGVMGGLARSTDKGFSWTVHPQAPMVRNAASTLWKSGRHLLYLENPVLRHSTDGGDTWVTLGSLPAGMWVPWMLGGNASAVLLSGGDSSGGSYLYRSTDEGSTWTQVGYWPYGSGPWVPNQVAAAGSNLIVTTNNGYLLTSTDGGLTWPKSYRRASTAWSGVVGLGPHAVAFGSLGQLSHSSDGGLTWTDLASPTNSPIVTGLMDSTIVALGTGDGSVLTSTDNGATFKSVSIPAIAPTQIQSLWHDGGVLLAGGGVFPRTATVARSADNGATFTTPLTLANTAGNGLPVLAGTAAELFAMANDLPRRSTDLGQTWIAVDPTAWTPLPLGANPFCYTSVTLDDGTPILGSSGGPILFGPR